MSKTEPPRNRYVGHRYVPKIFGEWDKRNSYEGLSIVTHKGLSYTSKQHVPVGIDIEDEKYWVVTGNYDVQVEYYRKEVQDLDKKLDSEVDQLNNKMSTEINRIDNHVKNEITRIDDKVTKDIKDIDIKVDREVGLINNDLDNIDKRLNPLDQPIAANVSRSAFIDRMNEKAKEIGMKKTVFKNPSGLYHAEQVTTARDMILLGLEAINYKELAEAWGRKEYSFRIGGTNSRNETLETTVQESSLNNEYVFAGGKTGTLSAQSQNNLMSMVNTKFSPNWFLGVVLGEANSRYTASRQLYDIANSVTKNGRKFLHHDNNLSNGNFDEDFKSWDYIDGTDRPILDRDEWFTFPQSMKCFASGAAKYMRRWINTIQGNQYYISAMVKVDRYKQGEIGLQFTGTTPATNMRINKVTDGWVLVSAIVTAGGNGGYINIGATGEADLDGWVDNVNVINLTTHYGASNIPSKTTLDRNLWRNIDSQTGIVVNVPVGNSMNRDNLFPLFEKNADEQVYPASVTKVMTAILMLENVTDLSKQVTVIEDDIAGGSGIEFKEGDNITLRDCLYLLMLPSSNTIANTVARIIGRKIALERV